jgi:hypothetical protein
MKKFFIAALCLVIAAGIYYVLFINKPAAQQRQLTLIEDELLPAKKERKLKQTDGPSQLLHREYLMTLDPATGDVPTERLAAAERILEETAMTSRVQASNILWQERGPNNIGGRTRAILIDKADGTGNTVWAGGVGGGLWKTTNFKNVSPTWTQVAGISANLAITCIAQHPGNNQVIYVGTGEGFGNIDAIRGLGVYTTTNGGTSWTLLASTTTGGANQSDFSYVQKLLVYTNGDVYAACRSIFCNAGGLLKSTTNGSSWTRVIGTATGSCATSLNMRAYDIEQSASGDLYASTIDRSAGSVGRIWKSPAGGTVGNAGTWVNITPAGTFQRIELACSPTDNLKVYATTQGGASSTGGTRLTIDGGTNWSNINVGNWCDQGSTNADFTRNQAWYDLILGVKPTDDATVYVGGVDVFKTTNSGTAWSQLTQWAAGCASLPYIHADIHAFEFFPGSPDEFIVGTDGGLFYTTNGGTSFTDKNLGYNVTQYYGLAIHPTSGSNYLLAGAQDNGSHKFTTSGINSVTTVSGGDGAFCHIDTDNPNFQYTSFTGTSVNFSSNGGASFSFLGSYASDRFINPSDYDPATDILYCGGAARNFRRVFNFTTTMTANSFTTASSTNHAVSAIKVDPNTANRIWVAFSTADGAAALVAPELYFIDAANGTPTSTAVTLPAGIATSGNYISSLDIENGDANHVVLTLSNYGVTSVWETLNGGTSWTSIEGNLPDMPVRWCKFMPAGLSPNTRVNAVGGILLATELGVWSTNLANGASTVWEANNTGMGNVRTDMIRIRTSDNKIAVATHGRGLFTGTHTSLLPVTLTEFKGTQQNKAVLLQWTTSSELNSKHFELQKSYNGTGYRTIATINAAGNSNSRLDYSFLDKEPLTETNHYRLRSVDLDGNNKLSNVVLIRIAGLQQEMMVLNNPFRDQITIRFAKAPQTKVDIRLLDMSGRLVARQQSAPGEQQVLLNAGSAKTSRAVYQLVALVDGKQYSQQVVAQ